MQTRSLLGNGSVCLCCRKSQVVTNEDARSIGYSMGLILSFRWTVSNVW